MQTNRVPMPDAAERSSFHSAFSQARGESRSVGVEMIRSKDPESIQPDRPRYEVRIEKRSGKRSADAARWNELGQQGWELISVVGKQAFFRRIATNRR
jgi:hypothetical protein